MVNYPAYLRSKTRVSRKPPMSENRLRRHDKFEHENSDFMNVVIQYYKIYLPRTTSQGLCIICKLLHQHRRLCIWRHILLSVRTGIKWYWASKYKIKHAWFRTFQALKWIDLCSQSYQMIVVVIQKRRKKKHRMQMDRAVHVVFHILFCWCVRMISFAVQFDVKLKHEV